MATNLTKSDDWMNDVQLQLEQYKTMLSIKEIEYKKLYSSYKDVIRSQERSKDTIENLQQEVEALKRKYENAASLSDIRGKELAGAQTFLSTADGISVAEVVGKVSALNEEIFQAAASLGEYVVRQKHDLPDREIRRSRDIAVDLLGDRVVDIISESGRSRYQVVKHLLVQVVIQMFLVEACKKVITAWDPSDYKLSKALRNIYSGIRASEPQAVSGRWRALTRAKTKCHNADTWKGSVIHDLKRLFEVASWKTDRPDRISSFERQLDAIFTVSQEVRVGIGEKITSADFEIYAVRFNSKFVATSMEEAYGDGGTRMSSGTGPEIVIGTTAMGIIKMLPPDKTESERLAHPALLPKVVVESSFRRALDPDLLHSTSRASTPNPRYRDGRG